jgi:phosphotransferase system enzyme I (PtsI)
MKVVRTRRELQGVPVSPGIVIGRAYLVDRRKVTPPERLIEPEEVEEQIRRFRVAIEESREQLQALRTHYEKNKIGHYGYLVDVHLLMLDDQAIVHETERRVRENRQTADWALWEVLQNLKEGFAGLDDEYFRGRESDVDHLGERILRNLVGVRFKRIADIHEEVIIVAHDLSPMDTAQMDVAHVRGFVTDLGGRTSHTAIVARALGIPAAVGVENVTDAANGGDIIVVDGISGRVVINPDKDDLAFFERRRARFAEYMEELEKSATISARTLDGTPITVRANVELLEELPQVKRYGAEGIGLYRTEFLYTNQDHLPTEDEHFDTYSKVAKAVAPHSVTIRTLDLGGDKVAAGVPIDDEVNPALGLRSIRLCLKAEDIFKEQLKGILRAAVAGNVRMMFPMVSGAAELDQALAILEEAKSELRARNVPFNDSVEVGVMVEVPSAAVVADSLAARADFLSIGTNDLIQYALAIDRVNEHVAYLYEPLHPAVLRLIRMTAEAGARRGISVSVCGEMAGDELYTLVLLGLGVTELSMHAASVPRIKRVVSRAGIDEARALADRALSMATGAEVHAYVEEYLRGHYPGLLDPLGEIR